MMTVPEKVYSPVADCDITRLDGVIRVTYENGEVCVMYKQGSDFEAYCEKYWTPEYACNTEVATEVTS